MQNRMLIAVDRETHERLALHRVVTGETFGAIVAKLVKNSLPPLPEALKRTAPVITEPNNERVAVEE